MFSCAARALISLTVTALKVEMVKMVKESIVSECVLDLWRLTRV